MIDLETIAENRARELDQAEKDWVDALKQPSFNEFSTYLSDGEIEAFILSFESPQSLLKVSGTFLKEIHTGNTECFSEFQRLMSESVLPLEAGLNFLNQIDEYEAASGRLFSLSEKLVSLKTYLGQASTYRKEQDLSPWFPKP